MKLMFALVTLFIINNSDYNNSYANKVNICDVPIVHQIKQHKKIVTIRNIQRTKKKPVMLFVSAEWCGACYKILSVMQSLKKQLINDVELIHVYIEQPHNKFIESDCMFSNEITNSNVSINALPTFIFIDANGNIIDTYIGAKEWTKNEVISKFNINSNQSKKH